MQPQTFDQVKLLGLALIAAVVLPMFLREIRRSEGGRAPALDAEARGAPVIDGHPGDVPADR